MLIDWQALKLHKKEAPLLVVDIFVLCLVSLDLLWLLIDTLVYNTGFGILLNKLSPDTYTAYHHEWHPKLPVYDSIFTVFLLIELALRWALAIYQKTYHRWFFYPFIHWYDVLAALPGLQFLRLLRLISVFYRLHKLGILIIGKSLIKLAQKYYAIIIEEISDRIVLNVLDGVQKELRAKNPVTNQLRAAVLEPQKDIISRWLAGRISALAARAYHQHEQELERYLHTTIQHAIRENPEWISLKRRLPLIGNRIEDELNTVVSTLVNSITAKVLHDLGTPNNAALYDLAEAAFDTFTMTDSDMDRAIEQIMVDAIDIIKAQVAIQQWKLEELQEQQDEP